MDIKVFPNNQIEKGYKGVIDRLGNFYALDDIHSTLPVHQDKIQELLKEKLNINIINEFYKHSVPMEIQKNYFFGGNIPDYKSMIIDFLGFCNYETYAHNPYAIIDVPNPRVANYQITREQQNTLIQLVTLNKNNLKSLDPIYSANQSLLREIYEIETHSAISMAGKQKVKRRNIDES